MAAEHAPHAARGARGILAFDPPAPWTAEPLRPEVELFAAMPPVGNAFTPNVVVIAHPATGSLADFSRKAVAGILGSLREGRIVDVGEWAYRWRGADADGTVPTDAFGVPLAAHAGRVVEYTHRAPHGRTVSGADYLVLLDGWAVQISTTTAIQDRFVFDGPVQEIARSVTVLRAPGPADLQAAVHGRPVVLA